jgi:leucyl aminopeptidase
MLVTADARNPVEIETDLLVLPLPELGDEKRRLPARAAAADRALGGRVSSVIEAGDFRGKPGQTLLLYPDGALPARRVLLLGLGAESSLDADALRRAGARRWSRARSSAATASTRTRRRGTIRRARWPPSSSASNALRTCGRCAGP